MTHSDQVGGKTVDIYGHRYTLQYAGFLIFLREREKKNALCQVVAVKEMGV